MISKIILLNKQLTEDILEFENSNWQKNLCINPIFQKMFRFIPILSL